jgi:large subunit ribosomal protein L18
MRASIAKSRRQLRRKRSVRSRLRKSVHKSGPSLRLSVNRTSKHISAQVIDDEAGRTLASATSCSKELQKALEGKNKTECATAIGQEIAKRATAAGVQIVVLDRGASRYHGRVKAFAEAAREGGLKF